MRQATEGLTFLHNNGYAHFYLKPAKLRVAQYSGALKTKTSGGQLYFIKISDFRFVARSQLKGKLRNPRKADTGKS